MTLSPRLSFTDLSLQTPSWEAVLESTPAEIPLLYVLQYLYLFPLRAIYYTHNFLTLIVSNLIAAEYTQSIHIIHRFFWGICLLTKFFCNSEINTHSAFWVILEHEQNGENFELPNVQVFS